MSVHCKFCLVLLFSLGWQLLLLSNSLPESASPAYFVVNFEESEESILLDKEFIVHYNHRVGDQFEEEDFITTDQSEFVKLLALHLSQLPLEKNDLMIFIHGMWGSKKVMFPNTIRELKDAYVSPYKSGIGALVGIKWPANATSYKKNKSNANTISEDVAQLYTELTRQLQILQFYQPVEKRSSLNLVCHSLGNQLFYNSMKHLSDDQFKYPMFKEIMLLAPDLDTYVFEEKNGFAKIQSLAQRIHVYYNERDLTLKYSQKLNKKKRLGLHGPSPLTQLPDNVYIMNVTGIQDDQGFAAKLSGHFYYRTSPTVCKDILGVLCGMDCDEMEGRVKADSQCYGFDTIEEYGN